jgi:hypothetical protein
MDYSQKKTMSFVRTQSETKNIFEGLKKPTKRDLSSYFGQNIHHEIHSSECSRMGKN